MQAIATASTCVAAGAVWASLVTPEVGFLVTTVIAALVGYAPSWRTLHDLLPSWGRWPIGERRLIEFAWDYLAGTGSGQIATTLLGGLAGTSVVGVLRVGGTLLSPISVVTASMSSLLISHLSRAGRVRGRSALRHAVALTAAIAGATVPMLLLPLFLPSAWGSALVGSSWFAARVIMVWLALEMSFTVVSLVPFAAHRALLASRESASLRTILGLVRIVSVPIAALTGGALGAAQTMAALSAVGAFAWWASYVKLMRGSSHA
jgi:O-antigen/teichoic acid export membrane protein